MQGPGIGKQLNWLTERKNQRSRLYNFITVGLGRSMTVQRLGLLDMVKAYAKTILPIFPAGVVKKKEMP